jgi:hypothetical protein
MEEELAALGYDMQSLGFWSDQAIEITYNAETNNDELEAELETCGLVGQRYSETRSRIGSHSLCRPSLKLAFGRLLFH